jgi:hypothetical protein
MAQSMKQTSLAKMGRSARWLFAGVLVAGSGHFAYAGPQDRVANMNKQAMDDYDRLEFNAARKTLEDTVSLLRKKMAWIRPCRRLVPTSTSVWCMCS